MEIVHKHVLRPLRPIVAAAVPKQALLEYSHKYARKRYLEYLRERLSQNWVVADVNDGPVMSDRLRLLTRSLDEQSFQKGLTAADFFYDAYKQVHRFFSILEPFGFNLRTCGSILDFGCGSARVLRLYRYINGLRLVGSDLNPECVHWCQENIPGCEFYANGFAPPLEFAKGDDFDLIVSMSVFTHIPLEQQTDWLLEMKRVLRPGGFLICSVAGNFHVDAQLGAEGRSLLRHQGEVSLGQEDGNASLSTRVGGSRFDVFQRRDRVLKVFGSVFKVCDYLPYVWSPIVQDLLVLQKV